jgi:hypothetical protein
LDRQIIYPGQIPQDTDLLLTNKNAMVAVAKLAAAALGVNGVVNGLNVVPTGPASLNVNVNPGEIYLLENIDATSYGSIAADTTHQVLKQGIMLDVALLSCPAPGTVGQSINYLIQAAFSETDTGAVALPYYNSSNPSTAWSGPANSGTPQATQRTDACVVTVKAGAAATTGSQTTPAPDAGNIGLAVVTVANGQATITAANIVQYTGAALVPSDGLASNVAHAIYTKNVAGNSDVTLTAQEAAYPILVLQGALTGNINLIVPASVRQRLIDNETSGAFQITVKTAAGTGVVAPQGYTLPTFCDGTNVESSVSALLTQAQGDARYSNLAHGKQPGDVFISAGKTAPAGSLAIPIAASNLTVSSYPALAAAVGTTWGNGSTVAGGSFVPGTMYVIVSIGTTDFTLVGAASNTVGLVFTATGVGAGTGTASTQFGIPFLEADYSILQSNGNVGAVSVGQVISHSHLMANGGAGAGPTVSTASSSQNGYSTLPTGGAANLAAGRRFLLCVQYQ